MQLRGQQNKSFAKIAEQIEGRSYNDVKNRWSQISRQIAALQVRERRGDVRKEKAYSESGYGLFSAALFGGVVHWFSVARTKNIE